MTRRATLGMAVAVLFILVNVAGLAWAAAAGEVAHAGLHAVLALVAAHLVGRAGARRIARY